MSAPGPVVLSVKPLGDGRLSTITIATTDHGQAQIVVPTKVIDTPAFRPMLVKMLADNDAIWSALETEV